MALVRLFKRFNNSMVGYLPIKILEGVVGILTLKVYTSLFTPDTYGQYGIINPTVIITFQLTLGWIVQVVTRFTHKYTEDENKKKMFYTTMLTAWSIIVFIIVILFLSSTLLFPNLFQDIDINLATIIAFFLMSYSLSQIMLTHLLYDYKRGLNAILLLSAAIGKLMLTIYLYRTFGDDVKVIFLSHGILDCGTGFIALFVSKSLKYYRIKEFSLELLKSFITFGYPLIGLTLTMFILNISDRYIIKWFYTDYEVGIYTANYAIASAVFTMIMMGLSRGIYPKVLKAWNNKDIEGTQSKLITGAKYYLIIGLPAATGLLLVARYIATIFLDIQYFEGYVVIGIIAFGMFFLGLSEYYNKGWELSKDTIHILMNSVIAAIVNILLNIIFIPLHGYIAAAFTTLFSFVVYFIMSVARKNRAITFYMPKKSLLKILLSTLIMAIIVIVCNYVLDNNFISLLITIIIAILAYGISLLMSGELKINGH